MRWMVMTIVLAMSAHASAAPDMIDKKCYAGTETRRSGSDSTTADVVATREVDPVANEIRTHEWLSDSGDEDFSAVEKIDTQAGTFTELDAHRDLPATGTLVGSPWHWTSYHVEAEVALHGHVSTDGSVVGGRWTTRATLGGALPHDTRARDLKELDCKQLDRRRAALNPFSAAAVHACFSGFATFYHRRQHVQTPILVEQVIDDANHLIELRYRLGVAPRTDGMSRFEVKGNAITVYAGNGRHGSGALVGKPGAWSQYVWFGAIGTKAQQTTGTFGGDRVTQVSVDEDSEVTAMHDADAFDCKDLAAKKAEFVAAGPRPKLGP